MLLALVSPLANWANFYVITGSSAGALIGLMFVVIALIQGRMQQGQIGGQGLGAFNTPTIVHFSAVLVVSAMLSAPWPALWQAALLLGLSGIALLVYAVIVTRRLRRFPQFTEYNPVMEDWLFYAAIPLVAYATIIVAGIMLPGNPDLALFAIAAVLILLLLAGIHNAWDIVTYMTILQPAAHAEPKEESESKEEAEQEDERKG